ncbi:MAG TPA: hypothetical protein VGM50_02195 [Gemmatimonadaceae bacterium]
MIHHLAQVATCLRVVRDAAAINNVTGAHEFDRALDSLMELIRSID